MILEVSDLHYEWVDSWGARPNGSEAAGVWAHHGLTCTPADDVVVGGPIDDCVLVLDPAGGLRATWPTGLTQPHGLTPGSGTGTERVWICDIGVRIERAEDGTYAPIWSDTGGRVVCVRLADGVTESVLPAPPAPAYREQRYSPTCVALDDEGVWVADGYGAGLVHRFSIDGTLELSLDGATEGAGAFDCPHACIVDRRRSPVEIYVADRANGRLVVFDRGGRLRRVVGDEFLFKPSAMTIWEELLIIADLRGRLTILDTNDRLVGHIGERPDIATQPAGFPNALDDRGKPVAPRTVMGRFNSPHDVATDSTGNIYVAEYVIGGRVSKLARLVG